MAGTDPAAGHEGHRQNKSRKPRVRSLSRKEARKQERAEQKHKKAQFFSSGRKRRADDEDPLESPQRKKTRTDGGVKPGQLEDRTVKTPTGTEGQSKREGKGKKDERIKDSVEKGKERAKSKEKSRPAPPPRSRIEEEEDAYIAYLEKKLGYTQGKPKKRQNSIEADGLDGKSISHFMYH